MEREKSEKYRFGHLRCKAISKPHVECPEIHFYQCEKCGNLMSSMKDPACAPQCCGAEMTELKPQNYDAFGEEVVLGYTIFGSVNENAIKATWDCKDFREKPSWVWLRTFTGGQLKYLNQRKRSPLIFGLADEDAYAYCDKDPCVECTFRCKRGFGLYFYFEKRGLIYLPLERMSARAAFKNDSDFGNTAKDK